MRNLQLSRIAKRELLGDLKLEKVSLFKMVQKPVLNSSAKRIGYFSTYPPRECGIANFTKDLIDSICDLNGFKHSVIAINEKGALYDYDRRVKWNIDRDDAEDYVKAAEYVNSSNIQLLVVQHEFGLYGGDYGEYIKLFLDNVKKPVITTLHTVQSNFDKKAIEVLKYLVERSEAIIVIAHAAIDMLKQQGIPYKKCIVIPHGCPSIDCTNNKSI